MRLSATLTNSRNGKQTVMRARPPSVNGGIWIVSERARRAAFKRIDADWMDTNAGITASATLRAVDENGHHTFTIYTESK